MSLSQSCSVGANWAGTKGFHQLLPLEPGSHTMGHRKQYYYSPGVPVLAKRLGTGHTRHLEHFHCQEPQIQRQCDRLMAQEKHGCIR